jgi:outer membrane receptor protein involved in Fe transport
VRATVAGLLCLPAVTPAFAADAAEYQLTIPSQPLRTALQDFARQSGIDVLVSSRITQAYEAPLLNGRFTPVTALQVLLRGTGLTFRQLDDRTIEVQPAPAGELVRTADFQGQSAIAGGGNLLAQNNATAQTPSAPASTAEASELTEVVVTGSRIARPDFTSLSPIVTVDASAIENHAQPGLVGALQNLPQFNVAGNSSNLSQASNPFPSATGAPPGAATVDLRGLGTNRTLVLLDGRRAQPVDAQLVIDLNSIPPAAVASVETITGGAASTYGADAIAGVVNFKLKQNFQGLEVDAQQGLSQYGDAANTTLSAVMGGNFADNKGNVMLVLDYSRQGQADQTKREWFQAGELAPGTPGGALGSTNLAEYVYGAGNRPTGAGAYGPPAIGTWIDQSGHLFNQYAPLTTGYTGPLGLGTGYKINPDGELGYNSQIPNLELPQNRWSALATSHYNITDHVTAYMQAQFSKTYTSAIGVPSGLFSVWSISIPYGPWDNPSAPSFGQPPAGKTFNPVPAALGALLDSRPNPTAPWTYNGSTDYWGPYSTDTTSTVYQLTTGLRGDIPGLTFTRDWTWDVYGSTGDTNQNAQLNGFPTLNRLQTLFSANMYGQNWTNTQYPISVGGTCTSGLPIFTATGAVNNATSTSPNCNAYADPPLNNITTLQQNVYEGDIQGSLLEMPFNAGRLRFALGADWRGEKFTFTPDSGYTALQAFPNIVQNIALPTGVVGSTGVAEVYTEFSIPVVKDLPFAKSIEIDPGIRFSDYSESSPGETVSGGAGNVKTWKLLGNWVVNDFASIRGGLEVANRAPNIAELFTPLGGSALGFGGDPCAVYPGTTPSYGNVANNPNRYNVQAACEYLIQRGGAPASVAANLMTPGGSANNYQYNVFGPSPAPFPFVLGLNSGNPNLKSETARTVTAGIVLNSPFQNPYTQRLRMSVDWYQIQVDGAIGVPSFGQVYQECLDAQYNKLMGSTPGTYTGAQLVAGNPYCAYINREYAPAAGDFYGAPRNYLAPYVNQGGIQSRGIDLELDWGLRFGDTDLFKSVPGGISVNIVANYLDRYAVSPFQGAAYINYTGTVTPTESAYRDRVLSTFGYSIGPANIGFRWQHLPAAGGDPTTPGTSGPLNAYNLVDFFASYALTDSVTLRGGIDNLMNAWPVWVGANASTTAVGTTDLNYDTIGRQFYLGVKAKF